MHRGVIYILSGEKFCKWGLRSIISLRKNASSDLPIHVYFIDQILFQQQFEMLGCKCIMIESPANQSVRHSHRLTKALVMQQNEFDQYVMIDADTLVQGNFDQIFKLLPANGVAGIEDGNFVSHLQMADFLFIKKSVPDTREFVKEMLGVDYSSEGPFPPYYNVGVFALTKEASVIVGQELEVLIKKLHGNKHYNPHDEQLPINSILHLKKIPAASIDPLFNYTKSRMKKNIANGTHDSIKGRIKVIHNRSCIESEWLGEQSHEINATLNYMVDTNPQIKVSESPRQLIKYLYEKHIKKFKRHKPVVVMPGLYKMGLCNPLRAIMLKLALNNPYVDIVTPECLHGFDLPRYYSAEIGYRNDRGKICYVFVNDKVLLFDYGDFTKWTNSSSGRIIKAAGQEAVDGLIKFQYAPGNYNGTKFPVFPFIYPGPNDFIALPPRYFPNFSHRYRKQYTECCESNSFDYSVFARWALFMSRPQFTELCKDIPNSNVSGNGLIGYKYFDMMSRSRFALAARGRGKWSHREMEICSMGVPMMLQQTTARMWRPFEAGKHYIEVTLDNFLEVFKYYDEHYDEAIKIGTNGKEYFDENHCQAGVQKIFYEIVETLLGKKK